MKKNIIGLHIGAQIKRYAVSMGSYVAFVLGSNAFNFWSEKVDSYGSWILYGGTVFAIVALLTFVINYLFYKDDIFDILSKAKSVKRKK